MQKRIGVSAPVSLVTTFHDQHTISYPATPARLGNVARLLPWRRLDGRWKVGGKTARRPWGFTLGHDTAFLAGGALVLSSTASAWAMPERLTRLVATKLAGAARRLDGTWCLGAMKMTQYPRLGNFALAPDAPGGGYAEYASGTARRLRLDGAWRIGGPAAPEFRFSAFKVARAG